VCELCSSLSLLYDATVLSLLTHWPPFSRLKDLRDAVKGVMNAMSDRDLVAEFKDKAMEKVCVCVCECVCVCVCVCVSGWGEPIV